jgi:hypothetical protein
MKKIKIIKQYKYLEVNNMAYKTVTYFKTFNDDVSNPDIRILRYKCKDKKELKEILKYIESKDIISIN